MLGDVNVLNAAKNRIRGTVPSALQNLRPLRSLALDSNLLYGLFPDWISNLTSLQYLSLSAFLGQQLARKIPTVMRSLPPLNLVKPC